MEITDREKIISDFEDYEPYAHDLPAVTMKSSVYLDVLTLLKEQEPRVMMLDEAAAAHEVWAEVWLSGPKKYVIVVTVLYLTDDCKNFELELLGTNKKAFMLTEAYGHTWRCWTARPTEDQRLAVKWDA